MISGLERVSRPGRRVYTGKKEIQLPAETKLDFKLADAVTLTK